MGRYFGSEVAAPSRSMQRLECVVQQYAWGKKGTCSIVANLKSDASVQAASDKTYAIKDNEPYAELWMGTHPNGPSSIADTSQLLSEWIKENPWALGNTTDIPYLFKVLSVNQALSIQAHPDKSAAKRLHKDFPHIYKDANHKPEMAIALTHFEALYCLNTFPILLTT
ncbi:hypothetical protein DYB32_001796 [Aphanomyces invadans]|uniref:mannose-6-phosphate isomerase n=1 Tax=Aphanomyces invadans TaxID=157072 RepID=A0A418B5I8_9STRA|nr:hypothetical protein DYB32_001796 [Aphanomyces invadans]